jgi:hypothetical protein
MTKTKAEAKAPDQPAPGPVIQRQPALPEKQGGPARAAPPSAACAADVLTAREPQPGAIGRARMMQTLQRSVGNAGLSRMLGTTVQTKLSVGAPDDVYEQEAEQVADKVMSVPAAVSPPAAPPAPASMSQRQLQAQAASGTEQPASSAVEAHVNSSRGAGQPLPDSVRAAMEPRFGQDFSGVRVHTNADSAAAASSLNARAFSSGRDIHFAEGQYQPETSPGQRLLAHEKKRRFLALLNISIT